MATPKIAGRAPVPADLTAGKDYFWCACGRSASQPFCDGSHSGTGFQPRRFSVKEDSTAYLCVCKHTKNPPYCDGSHAALPENGPETDDDPATGGVAPRPAATGVKPTAEEPTVALIHALAEHGLEKTGPHGEIAAMGVPGPGLPRWDDIQLLTAQLATRPLADDAEVDTALVIGPDTKKPLRMDIPLFVSDMSFGALSEPAKIALARGAEMAGTGICSGEGGMLPEERENNSRYLYELGTAMYGYSEDLLSTVQAVHFKAGQAAKTGVGGYLPATKAKGRVAQVRGVKEGQPATSPSAFDRLKEPADFARFADRIRKVTGGIPVGMKMSAQHIEADLGFALEAGVDYIILDGRGGGTGAAPLILRNHISVPTIPALARARRFLDRKGSAATLIVTGGLRTPADFAKALALGADGVAVGNAALQAIGCIAARICHTGNCPAAIATQRPDLAATLDVDAAAARLHRFLGAATELMKVLARACGHDRMSAFNTDDLTTWKQDMAALAGIRHAGQSQNKP